MPSCSDVEGPENADATELSTVAGEIDQAAAEGEEAAQAVRQLAEARRRGESWKAIISEGEAPKTVRAVMGAAERLAASAGQFRRIVARGLSREGRSTRDIGRLFEISHQRVSAILGRRH